MFYYILLYYIVLYYTAIWLYIPTIGHHLLRTSDSLAGSIKAFAPLLDDQGALDVRSLGMVSSYLVGDVEHRENRPF